jgi:hypothetical protein
VKSRDAVEKGSQQKDKEGGTGRCEGNGGNKAKL